MAACGVTYASVLVPWKVTVISTGDELVSPDEVPGPGQIRDINTYTIASRSAEEGFEVVKTISVKDDRNKLASVIEEAKKDSDVVIISGGSSQGKKDMTADLIGEAADQGVLTHGIAAKPGKPTITGFDKKSSTLFIGLPGHPVAALTVFSLLAAPLWRTVTGQKAPHAVPARVTENIAAAPGKATCVPVRLAEHCSPDGICTYDAVPVFGKSGLITTMAGADGYLMMDVNEEGLHAGDLTLVHAFA